MGCSSSKTTATADVPKKEECSQQEKGPLTLSQRNVIRTTWEEFKKGDYLKDGVYIFVVLFSEKPEAKELFQFVSEVTTEALLANERLERHVKRVLDTINMVVDHLDDADTLISAVHDLGARHHNYGTKPDMYEGVHNGVIFALKRKLGDKFTREAENAWRAALGFIGQHFKKGMQRT